MIDLSFQPNYNLCDRPQQKGIYHGVCKNNFKDTIMTCGVDNEACPAWKGYKYQGDEK